MEPRVIDITFKKARRQDEIRKELGMDDKTPEEILREEYPTNMDSKSLIKFCMTHVRASDNPNEKRIFSELVKIILERDKLKEESRRDKVSEMRVHKKVEEAPQDTTSEEE